MKENQQSSEMNPKDYNQEFIDYLKNDKEAHDNLIGFFEVLYEVNNRLNK